MIAASKAILEVNTKDFGSREKSEPYPSKWMLEIAHELDISVHLGSDAHHPTKITNGFEAASQLLQEIGYKSSQVLYDGQWQDFPLYKKTPKISKTFGV